MADRLLKCEVRRETNSSLARHVIMLVLHAVAGQRLDGAVVTAQRNLETKRVVAGPKWNDWTRLAVSSLRDAAVTNGGSLGTSGTLLVN